MGLENASLIIAETNCDLLDLRAGDLVKEQQRQTDSCRCANIGV